MALHVIFGVRRIQCRIFHRTHPSRSEATRDWSTWTFVDQRHCTKIDGKSERQYEARWCANFLHLFEKIRFLHRKSICVRSTTRYMSSTIERKYRRLYQPFFAHSKWNYHGNQRAKHGLREIFASRGTISTEGDRSIWLQREIRDRLLLFFTWQSWYSESSIWQSKNCRRRIATF